MDKNLDPKTANDETNDLQTKEAVREGVEVAHAQEEYTAKNIAVLGFPDAVRLRAPMYIGDTYERGFHHCVYEVIDNSIDEAMAGFCKHIEVSITSDGYCCVKDDGRGIPCDPFTQKKEDGSPGPLDGLSTLQVVLTNLHAGGKFNTGSYKVSGGLHGVGTKCVNALSDYFDAEVRRDGKIHRITFSRGIVTGDGFRIVGDCGKDEHGTTITFHPDPQIFKSESGEPFAFKWDILSKRFNELSFLNPGVEISFTEESSGKKAFFSNEHGIKGYLEQIAGEQTRITPEVIHIATNDINEKDPDTNLAAEIAMLFVDGKSDYMINSYANSINTIEGGTHISGFSAALTSAVNAFARDKKLLKDKEKNLENKEIRTGLYAIVSVKVFNPQFEGQTKTKLGNKFVGSKIQSLVGEKLKTYFSEHPKVATLIVEKALKTRRINESIERILKDGYKDASTHFLGKLADCTSRNWAERELFLVEGDSAGGSAKQGRDRRIQAILPLRGKVLNVQKATEDQMLKNNEIRSLISAIGANYGNPPDDLGLDADDSASSKDQPNDPDAPPSKEETNGKNKKVARKEFFDINKIKYDKVIIMTDADVDGAHIRTLLLTFFWKQMRPLIMQGHVYLAQPPLYQIKRGKEEKYIESDAQLTRSLVTIGAKDFTFQNTDGVHTISSTDMPGILEVLSSAEEICNRLKKQNIDLDRFFRARDLETGEFPHFRVITDTDGNQIDHYVHRMDEAQKLKEEVAAALGCPLEELDSAENPNYTCTEVLQANDLRRKMDILRDVYHFERGTFWGNRDGSPLGKLVDLDKKEIPVFSLFDVLNIIRDRGKKGLTVQRYKGLGEMDYDQLFDTTMDPQKRKLLRVQIDSLEEADKYFSILMGDEVDPRRRFIEENALNARPDA